MMLGDGKPGILTAPLAASSKNSAPKPSVKVDGSPVNLSIQFCVELSQSPLTAAVQWNSGTAVMFRSIELLALLSISVALTPGGRLPRVNWYPPGILPAELTRVIVPVVN